MTFVPCLLVKHKREENQPQNKAVNSRKCLHWGFQKFSVTFNKMVGVEEYFFHKRKDYCFEVLSLLRPDTHSRKNENMRSCM